MFDTETSLAGMFSIWILLQKATLVPGFVGVLLGVLNQHLEEPPNVRKSALRYLLDNVLDHFKHLV
jgi:hypothetical protein